MNDLPSVAELKQAAECGQRITPEDVSVISHAESGLTGRGPIRGGPAGGHRLTAYMFYILMKTSNCSEHRHATNEL